MNGEIFPQSSRLKEIIESYDWTLYEANQPNECPPSWEELSGRGPAIEYEIGKNYIFAPIPKDGQSLRDAYSITKGFGPSLTITDPNEERWIALYIPKWYPGRKGKPIIFSRLLFEEEGVAATSPATKGNLDPDLIGIDYPHLIDTFEKHFRVVSPEEYGIATPIPMPFHPEDN